MISNPCTECNGKGKTVQRRKIIVPVPAGVEDGQTVRMPVGNKEIFITFKVGVGCLNVSRLDMMNTDFKWILTWKTFNSSHIMLCAAFFSGGQKQ